MKIERLSLKNFKQFENASIDFATSQERNITIIYGVMGVGKSGIFQAINWCLYGFKVGNIEILPKEMLIANKRLLLKLKKGEIGEVDVELSFIDNFKRYVATRTAQYKKNNGLLEFISEDFYITVSNPSGKPELVKDYECERIINMILPSTAREYFLFDGEKIDRFSRIGQEDEIKDAIHQVLGLTSLNIAKKFLENARKKYSEENTGIEDKDIKEGIEEIERLENEIRSNEQDLQNIRHELDLANDDFSRNEDQLSKYNDIKEFIEERKNLELKKNDLFKNIEKSEEELKEELSNSGLILGTVVLKKALEIIQDFRVKKQIPSQYTETFIKDILNDGACICGRKVEPESNEYQILKKMLDKIPYPSDLQNQIITLYGDINKLVAKNQSDLSLLKKLELNISDLKDKVDENEVKLEDINKKIDGYSEEDFKKLEQRRYDIKSKIDSFKIKIAVINDRIIGKKQEIEAAEKELKKAKAANKKDQEIRDKIVLITDARKAIDTLYDTYAEDKRKQIDSICRSIFKKLIWKTAQFQNVELNDKYELSVLDRFNTPARPDLSAGERQLLSLAFITAMAKSAGKESPFVLDTPFARIAREPRENIAKHLPEMVSQLVLLVTDVELTPESERLFNQRVDKIYTLVFDDSLGISHIVEGKHV